MNIEKSYCRTGQHFVPDTEITELHLPDGGVKRMCYQCKKREELKANQPKGK